MRALLPWLRQRAEQLGLAGALLVIGTLIGWWAVFALRMIDTVRLLSAENAQLRHAEDPARLAEVMALADTSAQRSLRMIEGESVFFALLLFLAVSFLYLMARDNRRARERMEHQLQITTHELKTPIAGVRALIQTLRRGAIPEELQQDMLAQGLHACDRLEHIAETMLACQRAAAGRVRPRVISARALVDGVLAHRAATGMPERARVELGPEVLVSADPDAFRVILENLLDNAQKYADGASEILGRSRGGSWELSVVDEGPGLSEEDAARIFQPFARKRSDTVAHGSGLGLSLSSELARAMGGELKVAPGRRGSAFTLSLPLERPGTARAAEGASHG